MGTGSKVGSHYAVNLLWPAIDGCELKKFPIDEENLESIYSEAFFLNKQLMSAQTDLKDDLILNKVFESRIEGLILIPFKKFVC